jgi:hypothetical protein
MHNPNLRQVVEFSSSGALRKAIVYRDIVKHLWVVECRENGGSTSREFTSLYGAEKHARDFVNVDY